MPARAPVEILSRAELSRQRNNWVMPSMMSGTHPQKNPRRPYCAPCIRNQNWSAGVDKRNVILDLLLIRLLRTLYKNKIPIAAA